MELNFNDRLKDYLMEILIREGDHDAWEHLKTMNPNCGDLYTVIIRTRFKDEAWELYKQQSPVSDDLVPLIKHSDKRAEATAVLLQQQPLDNEDLEVMVEYAHSDEAARILLDQAPGKDELISILRYASFKDEAAKLLLGQDLENDELIDIITYSSFKNEAWERLLQQSPDDNELIKIIQFTDLKELAWQQLQNPSNEKLMFLANDYEETGRKKQEAAALILKQDPNFQILTRMIRNNHLVDEAWKLLKEKSRSSKDLEWLIRSGSIKVNEAAALSLKYKPDKKQLLEIFEYSDKKEEAAEQLVKKRLGIEELVTIVLGSNNQRALELLSRKVKFDRSKVDEPKLIREIKVKLLENPELLNVSHWHDGETHCLGGWAITLHEKAQKIEKRYSPEVAACLLLPGYTHLFFAGNETVLSELRNV